MTAEVAIPQRYHRAIMGPKGCRIQHITREHEVQIKFPERDDSAAGENGDCSEASAESLPTPDSSIFTTTAQEAFLHENGEVGPEEFIPRKCDIITISGRAEKCELAKAALLVGVGFSSGKRLVAVCCSPFAMLSLSSRCWSQSRRMWECRTSCIASSLARKAAESGR